MAVPDAEGDDTSARDVEEFLKDWADIEHLWMRIQYAERNALRLGDTVYLVSWSKAKGRPVLSTLDPGFYFPVLPDSAIGADTYPTKVHCRPIVK
ncbi:hypothetical protein ACFWBX_11575 [Streptomyces sp. NPDC059991]|uniref:hypothetical protein n=1 Tax=Streptomyces sp. NPDC059991 TaxID=3347028 RepID=UPI0036CF501D